MVVSDLDGNPEERFSHDTVCIIIFIPSKICMTESDQPFKSLISLNRFNNVYYTIFSKIGTFKHHLNRDMRKPLLAYAKAKTQISFAVTTKLISAFILLHG